MQTRFVLLNDYPVSLRLVVLDDRKGLIGRFFKCLHRRSSSDNCAARNWTTILAWPGFRASSVPFTPASGITFVSVSRSGNLDVLRPTRLCVRSALTSVRPQAGLEQMVSP